MWGVIKREQHKQRSQLAANIEHSAWNVGKLVVVQISTECHISKRSRTRSWVRYRHDLWVLRKVARDLGQRQVVARHDTVGNCASQTAQRVCIAVLKKREFGWNMIVLSNLWRHTPHWRRIQKRRQCMNRWRRSCMSGNWYPCLRIYGQMMIKCRWCNLQLAQEHQLQGNKTNSWYQKWVLHEIRARKIKSTNAKKYVQM